MSNEFLTNIDNTVSSKSKTVDNKNTKVNDSKEKSEPSFFDSLMNDIQKESPKPENKIDSKN